MNNKELFYALVLAIVSSGKWSAADIDVITIDAFNILRSATQVAEKL